MNPYIIYLIIIVIFLFLILLIIKAINRGIYAKKKLHRKKKNQHDK